VAEDHDFACDSGGFYWISKPFSQGLNINRIADKGYSAESVSFVNRLVNGGFNGYCERHAYSLYIMVQLTDLVEADVVQSITPPHPKNQIQADLHRPE
jgi:predicted chitinase